MVATQVRAHSTAPSRLDAGVLGDAGIIAVKPIAADVRIKLPLGPGPGITCALAGAEAAGLGHGGSVTELAGECVWLVGVASERDCCSALVAPPPDDLRAERRFGVEFHRPAAARKHAKA